MVSVVEASLKLGVSQDTIRKRIREGTLKAELINGRYAIDIPPAAAEEPQDAHTEVLERLVEVLTGEVEELRHQLAMKDQQIEVKDRQIFELHQMMGVKALEGGNAGRIWWKFWSR